MLATKRLCSTKNHEAPCSGAPSSETGVGHSLPSPVQSEGTLSRDPLVGDGWSFAIPPFPGKGGD